LEYKCTTSRFKIFPQIYARNIYARNNIEGCMDLMIITRKRLRLEIRKIIPLIIVVSIIMKFQE
jgi:hypothetical protein